MTSEARLSGMPSANVQASTALRSMCKVSALNSCSSTGAASASLPRPAARYSRDVRDHRTSGRLRDTGVRRLVIALRTAARLPRAWRSEPLAVEEKTFLSRDRRLVSGSGLDADGKRTIHPKQPEAVGND